MSTAIHAPLFTLTARTRVYVFAHIIFAGFLIFTHFWEFLLNLKISMKIPPKNLRSGQCTKKMC
jgi:hypothetical protein